MTQSLQRPMPTAYQGLTVAVIIPCYNEEVSIGKVVRDFRASLPQAEIYVCDNASTDRTAAVAATAGANVLFERVKGKGNAVWRLFADVEADIYLLVDGDDTYDASVAPLLIQTIVRDRVDQVVGTRLPTEAGSYRLGHRFGNTLFTRLVTWTFGDRIDDMLSGYRALSRRFVKSFPSLSNGFEIETELTVHALEMRVPIAQLGTPYRARPEGSASKLHTFRDGWRILQTILVLLKGERPLEFFGVIGAVLALTSIALGAPVVAEFLQTGLVPRLPTAVLASAIMMLAFLSLVCGLILDTVTRGRKEAKRLSYISIAPLPWQGLSVASDSPQGSAVDSAMD